MCWVQLYAMLIPAPGERAKLHLLGGRSHFRTFWILTDTIHTPTTGARNNLEPGRAGITGKSPRALNHKPSTEVNTGGRNVLLPVTTWIYHFVSWWFCGNRHSRACSIVSLPQLPEHGGAQSAHLPEKKSIWSVIFRGGVDTGWLVGGWGRDIIVCLKRSYSFKISPPVRLNKLFLLSNIKMAR